MQLTSEDLIQLTRATIAELVLPNLRKDTWEAGYLKSALVLLACAQAKAHSERDVLLADTASRAILLSQVAELLGAVAGAERLVADLKSTVEMSRLDPEAADTTALCAENDRFGEALNALIVWIYEDPAARASGRRSQVLSLLDRYNRSYILDQRPLFAEASRLPIF